MGGECEGGGEGIKGERESVRAKAKCLHINCCDFH